MAPDSGHPGDPRPHSPRRISLRVRLAFWVVSIFVVIQGVTATIFWLYQYSANVRSFDDRLLERAHALALEVASLLPAIDPTQLESVARGELAFMPIAEFSIDVFDARGNSVVQGRPPVIPEKLVEVLVPDHFSLPIFADVVVDRGQRPGADGQDAEQEPLRAVLLPLSTPEGAGYTLLVATSDELVRAQMSLITQVLALTALIGTIAAAICGWFLGGIAVAPFDRLRKLAQQLTPASVGRELSMDSANPEVARLTDELNEARRRMEQGFAAQERFISNVSHELKTPISTLLTEAQTLDRDRLAEPARGFVRSVEEEMQRLGHLVESFLTLTRVRDGKGIAHRLPCNVNDLVMETVDGCAELAAQSKVRLSTRLFEAYDTMETAVAGDGPLLVTMLNNLVRNAIRFSSAGGVVGIALVREDSTVVISVRDRGPGIPADRLATVFDRFAQAPEEQRKGRGHGLGLAIAQGIAELHGGSIGVANHEGGGCVFAVTLPALPTAPEATPEIVPTT
ncbi:MAG: HAMP domain-containing histidine kinase [Phycisphaerales bacterium]|nr:HAMP domain-containing histidine kinase [Phycisphaerales bacterium]